jgi:hypothetical protein
MQRFWNALHLPVLAVCSYGLKLFPTAETECPFGTILVKIYTVGEEAHINWSSKPIWGIVAQGRT